MDIEFENLSLLFYSISFLYCGSHFREGCFFGLLHMINLFICGLQFYILSKNIFIVHVYIFFPAGVVAQVCNLSTWEAKVREPRV